MMKLVSGDGPESGSVRRSAWYVGQNRWSMLWLPGRTVPTECAVAAIRAAEVLDGRPRIDDPVWPGLHSDVSLLGYTAREFAALLGIDCPATDPIVMPSRRFGRRSARR